MKISYNWLKEYIDLSLTPEQLAETLTKAGVVVEHVTKPFEAFSGIVVAEIKEIEKHPDADKLSVTKVFNGQELLQVVCGAKNIKVGQRVPLAQVGAVLPGDFKIKKSKLRGVESQGMLCSSDELGLDLELEDGIMILPEDSPIGEDIRVFLGLNDSILLLDLTPNRSDCLSILGVAKEVAALTGCELKMPQGYENEQGQGSFTVEIATSDCKNYVAQEIRGIKVGPSPLWLQIKLLKAGMRPINNVVDITNFVMLEYGQPLHGFDMDKIPSKKIVVKNSQSQQEIQTLDGQKRNLPEGTLTITDGIAPLAIAGVMGGENSEVDENTCDILIESAYFNNIAVRKSVKALNLRSEASSRFEKSVAPLYIKDAALRAAFLLEEICGGKITGTNLVGDFTHDPKEIDLDPKKVNSLLGIQVSTEDIATILKSLGCIVKGNGDKLNVVIPHHRVDITIDVDLVEEVARIYGYDNIPSTLPEGKTTAGKYCFSQQMVNDLKDLLVAQGVREVVTYPFISPDSFLKTQLEPTMAIPLANPLGKENSLMRTSMLPSALNSVAYNLNHNNDNIALFEFGKTYIGKLPLETLPQENEVLVVAQVGEHEKNHWLTGKGIKKDFYSIKGILESIMTLCKIDEWEIKRDICPQFHPGRSGAVYVCTRQVGYIGQLHPMVAKNWDIKEEVYILELNLTELMEKASQEFNYKSVVKFPAVVRDIAVIVDKDLDAGVLVKTIKGLNPMITSAEIFDVYSGKGIEEGKKSIAITFTLQKAGTLKEEEITFFTKRILTTLEDRHGAKLRQIKIVEKKELA
ncbi:phenylalanine--tRNA ligase subunit beta [Alkalicella caledoniensis]|uniref:Phenylalanine--tRNA ligase beta subunit n=1 Tax=Alkalicella caledoniensis TaxID=2731377 RepID=A0A7G9WAJ2_ALKCA|nr:phenylalanine--tRNA ligase subunit beta [Alkalicella caledoniensis]QNO15704.1 phenylalanine--tRNA ligase subunit beta [Alkalicella caledoniensis]